MGPQRMFGMTPWGRRLLVANLLVYLLLRLAFNLLGLFVFGPPVEERMGSRAFLGYYLLCGLGGAALSFPLMLLRPVDHIVGASAGVYGVMLAFAWFWPNQPIYVFPFPEPVPIKWVVTFAVAVSLVLGLLPGNNGVAHLAHLGGFATGFLCLKAADWRLARAEPSMPRAAESTVPGPSAPAGPRGDAAAEPRRPPPHATHAANDPAPGKIP